MKTTGFAKSALTIGLCSIAAIAVLERTRSATAELLADAEFKALIDGYYSAWSFAEGEGAAAPARAGQFYAPEKDLVFFDLAPMRYTGFEEYRAGATKMFDGIATNRIAPNDDLAVTRRGSVAWTTVTFRIDAKLKAGGGFATAGRHTAIWEKRGDRWLIVHEHVSVPMPE